MLGCDRHEASKRIVWIQRRRAARPPEEAGVAHRVVGFRRNPGGLVAILVTNLLVMLGWVVFRAPNLDAAGRVFSAMLSPSTGLDLLGVHPLLPWLAPLGLCVCWFAKNSWEMPMDPTPRSALRGGLILTCALVATLAYSGSPFLYFQF